MSTENNAQKYVEEYAQKAVKYLTGNDINHYPHFDIPQYEIDQGYSDEFMRAFKHFINASEDNTCPRNLCLLTTDDDYGLITICAFERVQQTNGRPDEIILLHTYRYYGSESGVFHSKLSSFKRIVWIDVNTLIVSWPSLKER